MTGRLVVRDSGIWLEHDGGEPILLMAWVACLLPEDKKRMLARIDAALPGLISSHAEQCARPLVEALSRYGCHLDGCGAGGLCNCGLVEVLKKYHANAEVPRDAKSTTGSALRSRQEEQR